jgi:hypothetical protein
MCFNEVPKMHSERVRRVSAYFWATELNIGNYHWITVQLLHIPRVARDGKNIHSPPDSLNLRNTRTVATQNVPYEWVSELTDRVAKLLPED